MMSVYFTRAQRCPAPAHAQVHRPASVGVGHRKEKMAGRRQAAVWHQWQRRNERKARAAGQAQVRRSSRSGWGAVGGSGSAAEAQRGA